MSHDLSGSYHPGSLSRWRRLLCCFPDRAATITREGKHAQFHAPYTRSVTADHRGLGDADNGDSLIMPSHLGGSTKKARNRKLKLFPSKAVHDSKITNHNVASVHTHKIEMPITVDRYLQKPIPPSSSQSNTECIAVPSSAHTVQQQQNYRPTLPNYVLNSLVRTTEHPSSCLVGSPTANGHGVNDLDNRPGEFATQQTVHQSTTKPHSSFTITFPKLPGFRRPPLETTPLPSEMTSRDISVIPSSSSTMDHTTPTVYTNAGAVPYTMAHDEASLVPRLLPHGASWDSGDVEVNVPSDIDQADYHTVVDQNGGQGDSSSENLDTMTPGMDLLGEIPEDCADKKCLVLDLDETLVHSWFKYVENANFVVPVDLDGVKHQIYVCKRPHLDEFLRAVGPLFECVMFTASLRKYADPVCDFIDIGSYFRHRLFREACVYHQNNLIKDLSRLGRDVDQICIVDNSPVSFLFQPNNALQITSWFDDPTDQALLDLIPYLTALAKSDTVVDYLREFRPPSSAAVAQPTTPSWLLLFNPSLTDDQEGSDGALDDVSYDYTEADAVLSPHFHPLSANTSTSLLRSYLAQADHTSPASTDAQLVVHQHRMQLTNSSLNNPTTVPPPPPPPPPSPLPPPSGAISFVHQVTRPETVGANAIGTRLPNPVELQDMKAI